MLRQTAPPTAPTAPSSRPALRKQIKRERVKVVLFCDVPIRTGAQGARKRRHIAALRTVVIVVDRKDDGNKRRRKLAFAQHVVERLGNVKGRITKRAAAPRAQNQDFLFDREEKHNKERER